MQSKNTSYNCLFTRTSMPDGCRDHNHYPGVQCCCFIIPLKVLKRFARDPKLPRKTREAFANAAKFEPEWRKVRIARAQLVAAARAILPTGMTAAAAAQPPAVTVFNCANSNTLPGSPVANPGSSSDGS